MSHDNEQKSHHKKTHKALQEMYHMHTNTNTYKNTEHGTYY